VPATATRPATTKLIRVSAAVDCGMAVNPDTVKAQIQGGIVHGLNAAIWGKIGFKSGVATVRNFNAFPMMKLRDCPRIDVTIVNSPGKPLGGVGEPGVPPAAPALANAYARLTGVRRRDLPLNIMTATSADT
jgi:isoquinoline 1-oxidoreductase beta subunit